MALTDYKKKRRFDKTPEPGPEKKTSKSGRLFVVQKHRASHLHYDFRLESDGVLKSWAVPKGPSLDPSVKRLAMQVEDHPVEYANFEGIIPEGEYGGGTVMVWDTGTYEPENGDDVTAAIKKGELKFTLKGKKLKGSWALVHTHERQWLLIKHKDRSASDKDVTEEKPLSAVTSRSLAEIASDEGGEIEKAATGDPKKLAKRKRTAKKKLSDKPSVWRSNRVPANKTTSRATKPVTVAMIPDGAKKKAMPSAIKPMLATLVDEPFSGDQWLFETKWDGVRAIGFVKNDKVKLVSRNQLVMTQNYPELVDIASDIQADTAILDGEIVALDKQGVPRFQLLQPRFGRKKALDATEDYAIAYYVFDLLFKDGYDLRACSLIDRKTLLEQTLNVTDELRYSDHILHDGERFFKAVEKARLEGMIAKRIDSTYVEKRSDDWLKVKTVLRQEVVIVGYTEPRGSRKYFGSLVVGLYEGDKLKYAGHTGGGFNGQLLQSIYGKLNKLETAKSPLANPPKTHEPIHWVKPRLVCEVKFTEWTNEGSMRHPVFMGLRTDKKPKDCRREVELPSRVEKKKAERHSAGKKTSTGRRNLRVPAVSATKTKEHGDNKIKVGRITVQVSNLDKVYWPKDGYTKGDLIRYYNEMADTILPYYKDRPLILKRYPNGISEEPFHQHSLDNPPSFVKTYVRQKPGDRVVYGIANNTETLVYVANLGSISLHPWASTARHPMEPDWMIFDVDPGQAKFDVVCDVALEVKQVLDEIGLVGYPKTSGSKGLHVYVPIKPDYSYEQVVPFANLVAAVIAGRRPDAVSIERMVAKRKRGRVYLDYLQNGFGKSVAGPYSVRAREGATVSAPLTWDEVKNKKFTPRDFTIRSIFSRLKLVGDLYRPLLHKRQTLTRAMAKLEKLLV